MRDGDVPSGWMAILVQVMIIIGLLIFANQIPKLIEGITGIKASGNFSLNPLKTITQSPIAAGVPWRCRWWSCCRSWWYDSKCN